MADLSESFGVKLDPWQESVLQSAMGERSDGTWSAKQVGLSAPRQNGKSQLIVARALAGALLFGERKIVISAHSQDTARETFGKFLEQIDASTALAERVEKVMNALNREFIKLTNGAVIQFKARTVSGSRGFSSDCLLLDEAQILGMPAWVSINSTMSARPNPQIWLMGTPPTPEDNGEVFTSIRDAALAGRSKTLAWLEWAADPTEDPALAETRAKANPAWNSRINHEIVQGEYETYPPARFALDRLGIWSSDLRTLIMPNWPLCETANDLRKPAALGVAVDIDRVWAACAVVSSGDVPHLAPLSSKTHGDRILRVRLSDPTFGKAVFVAEVVRIAKQNRLPVALDNKGPAASLRQDLLDAGLPENLLLPGGLNDAVAGCAALYDAVEAKEVEHGDYPDLNKAVEAAGWREVNREAGRRVWSRRSGDITLLEAATWAFWAATIAPKPSPSEAFAF